MAVERFCRSPRFRLKGVVNLQSAGAGFCRISELRRPVGEVIGISKDLAHVIKARDDGHAGCGALIDRRFVTKRLVRVIRTALSLYIKEIDVS